jgi:ribosomal protein L37AE/L43A
MLSVKGTDILSIDKKIKLYYSSSENKNIESIRKKIIEIDKVLEHSDILRYGDKNNLQFQKTCLEKELYTLYYDDNFSRYISDTQQYINEYTELLDKKISVSFIKSQKTDDIIKRKNEIISNYLKLARNYYNIEEFITEKYVTKMICSECDNDTFDESNEHVHICLKCGNQTLIYGGTTIQNDSSRINSTSKYTYDRKVHFKNTVYQYQGKQNSTIKPEVYTRLNDKFKFHKLLTSGSGKSTYRNIKKEHIYTFLKENGDSKHFEDVTLIHYVITGIKPPNISDLEEELFMEHEKILEVYETVKEDDRKNFLNSKYILCQLLHKHNRKFNEDDFAVLKTVDRLTYHNDICEKIFEKLDWTFTQIK